MKAKKYTVAGQDYRQEVMSVEQIKAFLKLLQELGLGQMISAGQLEINLLIDQIVEHDKMELFLATVLIPAGQESFNKKTYAENLERFSAADGNLLAEVIEDFLSYNEPWLKRLNKQMGKLTAPAENSTSSN